MPAKNNDERYWQTLDELENTDEIEKYLEREFPEAASELAANPVSRRNMLQLMGASFALAGVGMTGCRRWEKEEIVPLSSRPDGYVPGVPKHYATAFELGGVAQGALATCFDGRPIKMEGNEKHPFTGSGSTAFLQAAVLELYDPDRSRNVLMPDGSGRKAGNWEDVSRLVEKLRGAGKRGAGLAILTDGSSSETLAQVKARVKAKLPNAKWFAYEPLSDDNELAGTRQVFGQPLRPINRLDRADVIVALDADLFGTHPAAMAHATGYGKRRDPKKSLTRLYAIESTFSGGGAIADHRLPLRSELILPFLQALKAALGSGAAPKAAFLGEKKVAAFLKGLAADLTKAKGNVVLVAGQGQSPAVHALVAEINSSPALANGLNRTVQYIKPANAERQPYAAQLKALVDAINAKQISSLLILGGNPVYNAPADLGFAAALKGVATSVHLSDRVDETSAMCKWHIPRAHFLESWGDARSWDGTHSIVQPTIEPLHGGKSDIELLSMLAGDNKRGYDLVREMFAGKYGGLGVSDIKWRTALHEGFIKGSASDALTAVPKAQPNAALSPRQQSGTKLGAKELEVTFVPSSHAYDGRFANNAWLQETPDFMTKLTWDNAAILSPATASNLGLGNGSVVEVNVGGNKVKAPVYVLPGQAPYSVALALGHGRTHAGYVGGSEERSTKPKGFNAYTVRTTKAMYQAGGASLNKVGSGYVLATTQAHWAIDPLGKKTTAKRIPMLAREATLEEYKKPGYTAEPPFDFTNISLFKHQDLRFNERTDKARWAMATDLGKCIGCNSCLIACQAENNVAVVGKEQVANNREMGWIRIDRYFKGDPEDPEVIQQPVACQQCENAPCEQVCPVGATIHSEEGLNDMVYNRCVGTRYCLNNCPYKVRRFNFLDYHKDHNTARNKVRKLLFNPEVTVRGRGVMEKCTFCVQRIMTEKTQAKVDKRELVDGDIKMACEQACPTGAIVFGDLQDENSRVAKAHKSDRAYELLGFLNVHPRNKYLSRIKNPNKDIG